MIRFKSIIRFSAVIFLSIPFVAFSQEQLGMRLERFSGIYGASTNPANTAFNPNAWEVSLFSADVFLENNYAFLRNTSIQHALKNSDQIVIAEGDSRETPADPNAILLDFSAGHHRMHAVAQSRLTGPGFSFRLGEDQVLGFTTALRSEVSSYRIPEILAYRTISDLPRDQVVNIPSTGMAGMVWGEIGLHYSRLDTDGDRHVAWGVSPKYLLGYEGFYTRAQSSFDYAQRQGDTVAFGSANWDYALTLGNVSNQDNIRLRRQGGGLGLDAGISWAAPADEGGYAWRIGASVLDLGFVRFNRNAEKHHLAFDTLLTVSGADFPPRDQASDMLSDVSQAFLNDPTASLQSRSFTIGMPTALSLQADVQLQKGIYVGALLTQRVPLFKYSVKRPSTLAIVPRLERRWWSVSLPVVLNDWQSLRVGAAARLGWLYIGSDNLGSFFERKRLSGADFYVGLKINAFQMNLNMGDGLTKESRHKRGKQKLNKIKCYKF
ncbi:MAG: hypothetical protein JNJ57_06120 [Saprospiraceae bacterium]|nr:hypothetical protein [Saprospiraceae bacterium]